MRRKCLAVALCYTCSISLAVAQQSSIAPVHPAGSVILRPYRAPEVPEIRVSNSSRLRGLIRGGTLYLTAQDAIALALENNIDIEVARYNPLLAVWQLNRASAGGALPGVPSGASQAGSVASGQGVQGSQAAAGVTSFGNTSTTNNTGNATVSQIGPVTQTLDPTVQETTTFSHRTTPQPNIVQSVTPILTADTRVYTGSLQQGFLTGGAVTATYSDHYLKENSPTDVLNPSVAPNVSVSFQHNLARGFGTEVNGRTIAVAKLNVTMSDLNFKTQVIDTVTDVLNLYYGLAADYEDVKAKQNAVEAARSFYDDSKQRMQIGTLAELDVTRAETQVAAGERDLVDSQTSLQQQELQLKNLLSRNGAGDPLLAGVRVVPVDRIVVPDKDDLPPLKELTQRALANRGDMAAEKLRVTSAEVSALGTRNGLLPVVQVFGAESHAGLAGTPRTVVSPEGVETPDPYFVGGIRNGLGQIIRRNFPTERIGAFAQAPVYNRQAQADYGIDQLQLRQTQLRTQKDLNQVGVDVANDVIGLRQARARYTAAVKNSTLHQDLLQAEQKKFSLGASTSYDVIQQQRDLTAALSAEFLAKVNYSNARVALDQSLGATLEVNHIAIGEARAGKMARSSTAPPQVK